MSDERPLAVQFFVNFVHEQGTYFRFHNLAVGLTRLGHRVTVYAADHNGRTRTRWETRDGVPYHVVPEPRALYRVCGHCCDPVVTALRGARRYPPCDVAHLFQPFPGAVAGWSRAKARVRFYDWDDLWSGGLLPWPPAGWKDQWQGRTVHFLEARLPRWADHVTTASGFLLALARDRRARSVTLLYNGCWQKAPIDRVIARGRLGLRSDALYVGFMGRTVAELGWCFDAVGSYAEEFPNLRLALCGPPESALNGLPDRVRERVDYFGQLAPSAVGEFAAALDLGLLPLDDTPFNRSRFPIKFSEHLATGIPLLCSEVGDCGRLIGRSPILLPAGSTRDDWVRTFGLALVRLTRGDIPAADPRQFADEMSWEGLSRRLADAYRAALVGRRREVA